jgi:hypothetical protein
MRQTPVLLPPIVQRPLAEARTGQDPRKCWQATGGWMIHAPASQSRMTGLLKTEDARLNCREARKVNILCKTYYFTAALTKNKIHHDLDHISQY